MSGKVLTIVGAVLVGAAGGFMAGRMSSSQSDGDPELGGDWPSKSSRATPPRSRIPLPDYGLALGHDVETTLNLYDASVPGEVNWPLVDAMRDALYQPHSADRSRQWMILMGAMRPEDAPEVRNLFKEADQNGIWFIEQWNQFFNRWGQIDGPAAIAEITAKYNSGLGGTVQRAAAGWAANDPHGALQWLKQWDTENGHWNDVASAMIGGYGRHDLQAATDLFMKMGADDPRLLDSAMGQLVDAALLEGGFSGVTSWLDMLPDDNELRMQAFGHARYRVKRAGPEPLAAWLTDLSDRPYRRDSDYRTLASEMARENVGEALDWVASLPASPHDGAYTGVPEIVQQATAAGQIEQVSRWLEANPQHPAAAAVGGLLKAASTPDF